MLVVESLRAESSKHREEADALRRDVAKLRVQRDALHAHLEKIGSQAQTKVCTHITLTAFNSPLLDSGLSFIFQTINYLYAKFHPNPFSRAFVIESRKRFRLQSYLFVFRCYI